MGIFSLRSIVEEKLRGGKYSLVETDDLKIGGSPTANASKAMFESEDDQGEAPSRYRLRDFRLLSLLKLSLLLLASAVLSSALTYLALNNLAWTVPCHGFSRSLMKTPIPESKKN
jgi:hypothetical protein